MEYMRKRDIDGAKKLFQDIVDRNLLTHIISEKNRMKSLREMGDSRFWLAPWMAKTEEFWTILTEERLWNAYYQADEDTASGIIVKDLKDSDIKIELIEDINELLIEEKEPEELPVSLKYLVGELAFANCITVENGLAILNESKINVKEIGNNIYIPLDYEEMITAGFHQYLTRSKNSILYLAKQKKEMEEEEYNRRKEKIQKDLEKNKSLNI